MSFPEQQEKQQETPFTSLRTTAEKMLQVNKLYSLVPNLKGFVLLEQPDEVLHLIAVQTDQERRGVAFQSVFPAMRIFFQEPFIEHTTSFLPHVIPSFSSEIEEMLIKAKSAVRIGDDAVDSVYDFTNPLYREAIQKIDDWYRDDNREVLYEQLGNVNQETYHRWIEQHVPDLREDVLMRAYGRMQNTIGRLGGKIYQAARDRAVHQVEKCTSLYNFPFQSKPMQDSLTVLKDGHMAPSRYVTEFF